jgi:hypothetical protein
MSVRFTMRKEMTLGEHRFWQEWARFEVALPKLLRDPKFVGRWVVFVGGVVRKATSTREAAYDFMLERYGRESGAVVCEVVKREPESLRA